MKRRVPRIFVITGLGESIRSRNYRGIICYAKKIGFKVVPVNIHWSTKLDMTDFISQADEKIPTDLSNDYILGFSFGSYIAAVLSSKRSAKGFIFCSTSPYFKENLKHIPKETKKYFGPKLLKSLKKYSIPVQGKSRAWFLIGQKDWNLAVDTTKKMHKAWHGKKNIYTIRGVGHELAHPKYIERIQSILKNALR